MEALPPGFCWCFIRITVKVMPAASMLETNLRLRQKPTTCYRTFCSATRCAHAYQRVLEFPGGASSSPELAASYVRKYPVGAKVSVYYNPDQPDQSTLEPGLSGGDWMIPALGVAAMAFGIFALFSPRRCNLLIGAE